MSRHPRSPFVTRGAAGEPIDADRRRATSTLLAALGVTTLAGCASGSTQGGPAVSAAAQALDDGAPVIWLDTIADLSGTYGAGTGTAIVRGNHASGDGGGGVFVWQTAASSSRPATDGGTVFQVAPPAGQPPGYWQRIYDGDLVVQWFGARGDGVSDDTVAIQRCLDAGQGRVIRFPTGLYRITSTLHITSPFRRLVGSSSGRNVDGGTELRYFGSGAMFEIGADNGQPWDANSYDGPQDQWFENLWLAHGAPDTALTSQGQYRAGSFGIRDWRGGGIRLRDVGIEHFEFGFWGIQSDINLFDRPTILYCKVGIYAGPRSDQFTITDAYTFFCDTFLRVDAGVRQLRLVDAQIVGCGSNVDYPVDIYKATGPIRIVRPWFEHFQGYAGADQAAFIAVGLHNGYRDGAYSDDRYCKTVSVEQPVVLANPPGAAFHTKYLIDLGAAYAVRVTDPEAAVGIGLSLDGVFHSPAGTAYAGSASLSCSRDELDPTSPKLHVNDGTGVPQIHADFWGWAEHGVMNSNGRLTAYRGGGAPGAGSLTLSTEGVPGVVWLSTRGYPSGTDDRVVLRRALQSSGGPPATGVWEHGDLVLNLAPAAGGNVGWVCVAGGTPGTWKPWGVIAA